MTATRSVLGAWPAQIGGVAAGALIYAGVVLAAGVLAAIAVPSAWFAFFGRPNRALALAMLDLGLIALPIGLGVFVAASLAMALARRQGRDVAAGLFIGLSAGWLGMALLAASPIAGADPGSGMTRALVDAAMLPWRAPWWSLPALAAPWVGCALAVIAARRRTPRIR